jgi:cell division protease FtsH
VETLDEDDAYAAAGIDRQTAPGAVARGEAGSAGAVPGSPSQPATVKIGDEQPIATPRS